MKAAVQVLKAGEAIMEVYGTTDFEIELKEDESPLTLADRRSHNILVEGVNDSELPVLSEEGADIPWEIRSKWDRYWLIDPLDGTKEFIKRNNEFTVNIALMEADKPVMGIIYLPVHKKMYFALKDNGAYLVEDVKHELFSGSYTGVMGNAVRLPSSNEDDVVRVIASRSHLSEETQKFMDVLRKEYGKVETVSAGSSLKLCLIAEARADIYPRMGPTMEWDIAAGDIIITESGGDIYKTDNTPLLYNKKDLRNPYFIARSGYFSSQ